MLEVIKLKIKQFLKITSDAVAITCQEDYARARSWLKKATIICGICSVLGIAYGLMIGILSLSSDVIPFGVLSIPIGFILGQWSFWGVATFILNIREILNIKKIVELGKIGYTAGKEIKETHINVTHEFGNQYKVTSHTEHKGCLFALAAIFIRFLFWMYFSVMVGAFLTVKKLIQTVHNIKEYQKNEI